MMTIFSYVLFGTCLCSPIALNMYNFLGNQCLELVWKGLCWTRKRSSVYLLAFLELVWKGLCWIRKWLSVYFVSIYLLFSSCKGDKGKEGGRRWTFQFTCTSGVFSLFLWLFDKAKKQSTRFIFFFPSNSGGIGKTYVEGKHTVSVISHSSYY